MSVNSPTIYETDRTITERLDEVSNRLNTIYERQTSIASSNTTIHGKPRMFQIRRTFLLIILFDVVFMILLWIIYNEILSVDVNTAFKTQVFHYEISNSTVDVVGISTIRFVCLLFPYAILKWSHWFFVAFTTLGTTGFIIAKTIVYTMNKSGDKASDYILFIASFIIAWIEIWFFDCRVLPHERRLRGALNNNERRPLLSTGSLSPQPIETTDTTHQILTVSNQRHESFYSPIQSIDGSDMEQQDHNDNEQQYRNQRADSNISQLSIATPVSILDNEIVNKNEEYEKQADDLLDEIWRIYQDDDVWYEEGRSSDGLDIVLSKTYPKWGKIFRLNSTVEGSRKDLIEMLFERQEDIPKWNTSVNDCQILEVIHNNLFVTYQLTNEQAQGFIAKRDFVNITARRFIDDIAILAAQACEHSRMPQKDNCVRAENGPTAYVIENLDDTTCRFTWILNVNLKGWLPQYVINSSLSNVQLGFVEALRNYLSNEINTV